MIPSEDAVLKGLSPDKEGVKNIKRFIESLPAVTRPMANAAIYMIFDDHEVTDDWNLYKQWTEKVLASDSGRRMVTNALTAYWLCQAWGNDPSRFDAAFAKQIQDYCDLQRTSKGKVSAADSADFDKFIWGFHDWSFYTPTLRRSSSSTLGLSASSIPRDGPRSSSMTRRGGPSLGPRTSRAFPGSAFPKRRSR